MMSHGHGDARLQGLDLKQCLEQWWNWESKGLWKVPKAALNNEEGDIFKTPAPRPGVEGWGTGGLGWW